MSASNDNSVISDVLKNCVIPWVERDGMSRVFTARLPWQPLTTLPDGMTATHKPILGKRLAARGGRAYGSTSVVDAHWPEDNLQSARTPKLCFAVTGSLVYQAHDYVLHCQPGHGILLPPGTPFANSGHIHLDPTRPLKGICEFLQMMPYRGGLICWLSRRQYNDSSRPHVQESTCSIPHSRVPFYLNQLVDEALKNQPHQQLVCDSLLKIALALLRRELQELPVLQTGEIPDVESASPEYQTYSIRHAQEYIENNLRETLSINKVARMCACRALSLQSDFALKRINHFRNMYRICVLRKHANCSRDQIWQSNTSPPLLDCNLIGCGRYFVTAKTRSAADSRSRKNPQLFETLFPPAR